MNTLLKTLLIIVPLSLAACSSGTSEKATGKDPMSRIPKDLRVFDGYTDALEKAKKIDGTMEERAKAQVEILKNI